MKGVFLFFALLLGAMCSVAFAVNIRIDYSLDTSNFFNTAEKCRAMEAVASFYSDILDDTLLRIDPNDFDQASWDATLLEHPATGNPVSFTNLIVDEDEFIVYVGARQLNGNTRGRAGPGGINNIMGSLSWFERISARGNPGALGAQEDQTDFVSWGGAIAFDIDTVFSFSLTDNQLGIDFVSIAMHEMGHVLGLGSSGSWANLINSSNRFTGSAVVNSFGSLPEVQSNQFHFVDGASTPSMAYGSFGTVHGISQPALMVPTVVDQGVDLFVLTDVDLAALVDIGWELKLPNQLVFSDSTPGTPTLSWNSSSFFNYTLERSADLVSFPVTSSTVQGNGAVQSIMDSGAPVSAAFYRLERTNSLTTASSLVKNSAPEATNMEKSSIRSIAPVMISCGCDAGH